MRAVLDEQSLMPPPPSAPISAPSSTMSTAFAVPSVSPLSRFADLSLRSPAIASLVSGSPSIFQHPHPDNSLPTPEKEMVVVHREPSSVSPSAAEKWSSPLRRTKDVSPTPSSEHEPSRMGMGTQTTPSSTAEPDALGDSTPPPAATADSEDVAMTTSSSFVEPPPTTSTSIVSNTSSTLNVPTERPPLLQLQVHRRHDHHHMQSKL
jgi:hypothetical protein